MHSTIFWKKGKEKEVRGANDEPPTLSHGRTPMPSKVGGLIYIEKGLKDNLYI
jgi:hypothetical protein